MPAETTRYQRFTSPGHRAGMKRLRRRAEKKDPENAGTKIRHFTRGWTD